LPPDDHQLESISLAALATLTVLLAMLAGYRRAGLWGAP
jgi:hypothetical protein